MTFDNKPRASRIKLAYMIVPLFLVSAIGIIYLAGNSKSMVFIIIAAIIFILYFAVMAIFRFNYISFYAGPDKVRLRYKPLSPFPGQNNSIQINSKNFAGYKIKYRLGGLLKSIILMQKSPGGIAAYPNVSINSLNKPEIEKICKAMDLVNAISNHGK